MATFERFEEVDAWKKARVLVAEIYAATRSFQFDRGLVNQIRRAGLSIMLNIAEGCARRTDKEFTQYLFVASGSIAELKSALYIALDQGYLDDQTFNQLFGRADEVSRMISGLIKYLRS